MNDVNLNSVDSALRAGSTASPPPQQSQQAAVVSQTVVPIAEDGQQAKQAEKDSLNLAEQSDQSKEKQLEGAVTKLNDYIQTVQRDLEFQTDDESGKSVITVIDRQTSKVVRQMPDDVALRLAQDLQQDEPISLLNIKV